MRAPLKARGQAMSEYLVVLLFTVLALAAGSLGDPSPIEQLVDALKSFYGSFSFAISLAD